MKGITFEQVDFGDSLLLNHAGQFFKESIECDCRRYFKHAPSVYQFVKGLPLRCAPGAMIAFRGVQRLQKFTPIETDGIAENLEVFLGDLNLNAVFGFPNDRSFKGVRHDCSPCRDNALTCNTTPKLIRKWSQAQHRGEKSVRGQRR